jgi:hypothetical protein
MAAALSDYAPRAKDAHILDEKQVHGPPEKKQKIEETNIDPMTMNDEDDELPEMTDEEMALYGRQVKESGVSTTKQNSYFPFPSSNDNISSHRRALMSTILPTLSHLVELSR